MRALDKEPGARFATVADFLDALEGKAVAPPVSAARTEPHGGSATGASRSFTPWLPHRPSWEG